MTRRLLWIEVWLRVAFVAVGLLVGLGALALLHRLVQ